MDMYGIAARLRRGLWGAWIGGFLLALDGSILPAWAIWFGTYRNGGSETMEVMGTLLPLWVCLALGPMAILSVVGVVALAVARNERGFRVASTVAVAWVAFVGIACVTGAMPVEAFIARLLVLGILLYGRTVRPDTVVAL